ncbi:MAG: PAS domain S-box protein [Anaerolineaceae bacterium]|nr:MAG: PAS domain S-box protein [Anaerolineaceae bacterium]
MNSSYNNIRRIVIQVVQWLIEPSSSVMTDDERQSARLVSGLLLFLTFMLAFASWFAFTASFVGYILSRMSYYQVSKIMVIIALSIPSTVSFVALGPEEIAQPWRTVGSLGWLVLVLVLVSIWSKGWVTGVMTLVMVGLTLSLLFIRPEVNISDIGWLAALFGVAGGLLATGAGLRNRYVRQVEQQNIELVEQRETMSENEQRYRELVEDISDIIYRVDTKGYFTYVSPSASILTGYSEAKLIGMHFTELVEPSARQKLIDLYSEQLSLYRPESTASFPIVTASGETRWVEQKTSLSISEDGMPLGFQSIVRDITERKLAEEKIQALYTVMAQPQMTIDEQLEQALRIGTEILGLDLGIISQIEGNTYKVLYGHSPDGSLQTGQTFDFKQTYCNVAYQADELVYIKHMAESSHSGHPCYNAFGLETYIGIPLRVNSERFGTLNFSSAVPRTQPFSVADREFFELMAQWVSMMLERQIAETRLQASEANFRSILDNSPSVITRADRDGLIEFIRIPEIDDITLLEPIVGQSLIDFVAEDHRPVVHNALRRVFTENIPTQYEAESISPDDGSMRWHVTNVAPIIEGDEVVSALLISSDITERKRAEEQLKRRDAILQAVAISYDKLFQVADWKQSIQEVLQTLGSKIGLSRTFIFRKKHEASEQGLVVDMPYEWVAEGVQPDIDNPIMQNLPLSALAPRWAEMVEKKQVISGLTRDFAEDERALLSDDVIYLLIIPIFVQGQLWGAFGFDDCGDTHEWINVEIDLLQSVADNIGAAIERQLSEAQLRETYDLLDQAQSIGQMGNWEWNIETGELYWSDEIYRLNGLEPGSVPPTYEGWLSFIHPDERDMVQKTVEQALGGTPYDIESRIVLPDGTIRYAQNRGQVVYDTNGQPLKMQGVTQDITDRKRAEQQIRSLFAAIPDMLFQITVEGVFIEYKPSQNVKAAMPPELFLGKNIKDVLPALAEPAIHAIEQSIQTGTEQLFHYELPEEDGIHSFEARITQSGHDNALLIVRDITDRKRAEQQIQTQNESLVKANRELAVARRQAEAASTLKSQFLATMSHELRTPLNAVIGYAQLQLAGMVGELSPEQHNFQERILANANHLLMLINEVLDLSKIEAGRLELMQRPFNLRDCVEGIMQQNRVLADDKHLAFILNFDERLPETIVGDEGRIKQIIINLVSNAIKFTDEGSVTVDVALYDRQNWRITVADTGIGIAPHLQETIFDEFRQAETGMERGGTGLGLAIVRKLALMMGGNIRLNSELGKGSAFVVTFPIITEHDEDDETEIAHDEL